jgi:hypothetical protein
VIVWTLEGSSHVFGQGILKDATCRRVLVVIAEPYKNAPSKEVTKPQILDQPS